MMQVSSAIEDLADSFPALLFALATGFGPEIRREAAIAAANEGLPLREVAAKLGLPMWLRKVAPAALQSPLVEPPSDPVLGSRLLQLMPVHPGAAAAWLERVSIAHHVGGHDLSLWVAQQFQAATPAPHSETFLGVLAWAWFSGTNSGWRAEALLTTRWQPSLGIQRAAKEVHLWKERLALDVCLGQGLDDAWLDEGSARGFDFVALRTADDFIAEALAMDNCLDRYSDRLIGRVARIFSIRHNGRSVADVEIVVHDREPGHPTIGQLRGARNRRASLEVWQAAYAWLGAQSLTLAEPRHVVKVGRATRMRRRAKLWQPFLVVLPEAARVAFEAAVVAQSGNGRARREIAAGRTLTVTATQAAAS